jgi:hypothetical protein
MVKVILLASEERTRIRQRERERKRLLLGEIYMLGMMILFFYSIAPSL